VSAPREPLVLPEFGPPLPAIVRRRTGLRERTTIALLAGVLVLAALAVLVVWPRVDGVTQLVHRDEPVFNLLYDDGALHTVAPRQGELARLEGERGRLAVAVTVSPVRLPAQGGDVAHGGLPVFASGHIEALRAQLDGFQLRYEGRARFNGAPGYEVRFRTGPRGRRAFQNDVLLVPAEDDARGAVLLSLRRELRGRTTFGKTEQELSDTAAEAFHSFKYGTAAK
jgi:hypothetical protein